MRVKFGFCLLMGKNFSFFVKGKLGKWLECSSGNGWGVLGSVKEKLDGWGGSEGDCEGG